MGSNFLGLGYMPPPVNNYSIAGDFSFNSRTTFNITGAAYDLQTVALHEFGHTIGLDHSLASGAVMFATYNGTKRALPSDDAQGAQALYGTRTPDAFDAAADNGSFATASTLTSYLDPVALTAQFSSLDVTTTADVDYYTFVAPAGSASTMTVNVQSAGLSLLRPAVTVYAADQTTVLGSANAAGSYNGGTLSVTVNGISPQQQFYVKVTGADTTQFGTGRYALTLNLGTGSTPTVTPPNTQLLNGNPLSGGGGIADTKLNPWTFDYYSIGHKKPHTNHPGSSPAPGPSLGHWHAAVLAAPGVSGFPATGDIGSSVIAALTPATHGTSGVPVAGSHGSPSHTSPSGATPLDALFTASAAKGSRDWWHQAFTQISTGAGRHEDPFGAL
jgi:hypothetical protein